MPKKKNHKNKSPKILLILFIIVFLLVLSPFINTNPKWVEPNVLQSQNGQLDLTLNASKSKVNIGGKETESNVWNNKYIGDTWVIKGGDKVKVHYVNNMTDPTNLHFHGAHISPKGNSDNVLISIKPGENFDYEYNLPVNHPPGFYWYHPHLHTYTDDQVNGGMLGAIIVKGNIDELPGIKGVEEKVLVLTTNDNGNNVVRLVNNQTNPTLFIRPLQTVRLRIVNASSDDFYNFAIPGEKLHIISRDGNTLSELESVDSELLAPGDRVEILYKAGLWGEKNVESLVYAQGFFTYPKATFMKIKVAGLPVIPQNLPTTLIPYDNFKNAKIDKVRTLTFSEGGTQENTTYLLDGKQFNPSVINQIITLGTTEEWHLVNKTAEVHPFHIHINPFQVISVNGVDVNRNSYDDTFPIPANGEVVIRTKYLDFDGKYVLHCHILFHEDHGMMQVVEVVKPGNTTTPHNGMPDREDMPDSVHSTHSTMQMGQ